MLTASDYIFTWRSEWISEFESPWSIFEKFKVANHVNANEILRHLGTEQVKKTNILRENHFNFYNLASFDYEALNKALGSDIITENKRNLEHMIGVLPFKHLTEIKKGWESVYLREKLYYCSECLKTGYHCLFHQFKLFDKCPIHNIFLENCCPKCGVEYPYLLSNKTMVLPFVCVCGHQYCNTSEARFYDHWKQYDQTDFILPEFNRWLNLNDEDKLKLSKMYFIPDINFEEYNNSIVKFLSVLGDDYPSHHSVSSSVYIKEQKSEEEKLDDFRFSRKGEFKNINDFYIYKARFDQFQKDYYQNYKRIFAGLAKQIRKTVLLEHKKGLFDLKKFNGNKANETICPFAYAYMAWRRSLQNFTDFTLVDHFGRHHRLDKKNIELPQFMPFVYDLFLLWSRELEDITKFGRASTKWLINRVVTHVIWNHFNNWLIVSEDLIKKREMPLIPPFNYENLSFFIAVFSGESKEKMEFHWWNNENRIVPNPVCNHCN